MKWNRWYTAKSNLRTKIPARSIAGFGYAAVVFIIVGSNFFGRTLFVFPVWVLLLSVYILVDNMRMLPKRAIAPN